MRAMPRAATLFRVLLLALAAAGAGIRPAAADTNLIVSGAWIRQPPPGSDVAAAYLTVRNAGTTAVELIGVQSPAASMAMMHETLESGGRSRMRRVAHLKLAPNQTVQFRAGGLHIMLSGLAHPLQVGERVPLVLQFTHGVTLHINAVVRPLGSA